MTTLRTFIAIDLDDPLRAELGDLQESLRMEVPPRSVRWVRPDGIHLTLKFLGDTPLAVVDDVKAAVARAAGEVGPFTFEVGGLGCFPTIRRPRVVWVSLHEPSGALVRLRDAVEANMAPLGFPTEKRPFSPHLTLGRVQRYASSGEVRRVGEAVATSAAGRVGQMAVARLCYIKSDLQPSGAVYTTLLEADLGAA